jgi:ribonuclease E
MTRKRVGQGLIEAFSTTCESCGGRGIHVHSEPVRKVALEKDMEQRYVPASHDDEDDHAEEDALVEQQSDDQAESESSDQVEEPKKPATRKRRRAVSTGIITPV